MFDLGPLRGGVGVADDAGAGVEAQFTAVEQAAADGHIEFGCVRGEPADGSGIPAAIKRFQRGDSAARGCGGRTANGWRRMQPLEQFGIGRAAAQVTGERCEEVLHAVEPAQLRPAADGELGAYRLQRGLERVGDQAMFFMFLCIAE
ncbi:MAG: hypothetical protein NTY53_12575 [Kiritimatiellaeota bacterium]|nr:hypothetical protein [Kiritimatiellota bacterium]